MATANLASLPPELISSISSHLITRHPGTYSTNLYGLYGLRLACCALYSKTQFDFNKAAFSTLIVDFSPERLDRLYAISQHPSLSRAVKSLYFARSGADPICLGEVEDIEESGGKETTLEGKLQPAFTDALTDVFRSLVNLEEVVVVIPFTATYYQYRQTTTHPHPSDTSPHSSRQKERAREAAYQWVQSASSGPPSTSIFVDQWTITADMLYRFILDAADVAGSNLQKLDVQRSTHRGLREENFYEHSCSVCIRSLATPHKGLRNLRRLRLTLDAAEVACPYSSSWQMNQGRDGNIGSALLRTLLSLQHLNDLTLSFTKPSRTQPRSNTARITLTHTLSTLHIPQLTRFALHDATTSESTLSQFLHRHKNTLQILLLQCIVLLPAPGGSWRTVLTNLLNENLHKLSELHFEANYEGASTVVIPIEWAYQCTKSIAAPDMRTGLQSMLMAMQTRVYR